MRIFKERSDLLLESVLVPFQLSFLYAVMYDPKTQRLEGEDCYLANADRDVGPGKARKKWQTQRTHHHARAHSAPLAAGENKPGDGGNAGVLPFHGHRGAQTVPSAQWSCSSASRRTPRWATQEDKRTTRSLRS